MYACGHSRTSRSALDSSDCPSRYDGQCPGIATWYDATQYSARNCPACGDRVAASGPGDSSRRRNEPSRPHPDALKACTESSRGHTEPPKSRAETPKNHAEPPRNRAEPPKIHAEPPRNHAEPPKNRSEPTRGGQIGRP